MTGREQKQLNKLRREWEAWHVWVHNSGDFEAQMQREMFDSFWRATSQGVADDGPMKRHDASTCDVCSRVKP